MQGQPKRTGEAQRDRSFNASGFWCVDREQRQLAGPLHDVLAPAHIFATPWAWAAWPATDVAMDPRQTLPLVCHCIEQAARGVRGSFHGTSRHDLLPSSARAADQSAGLYGGGQFVGRIARTWQPRICELSWIRTRRTSKATMSFVPHPTHSFMTRRARPRGLESRFGFPHPPKPASRPYRDTQVVADEAMGAAKHHFRPRASSGPAWPSAPSQPHRSGWGVLEKGDGIA